MHSAVRSESASRKRPVSHLWSPDYELFSVKNNSEQWFVIIINLSRAAAAIPKCSHWLRPMVCLYVNSEPDAW